MFTSYGVPYPPRNSLPYLGWMTWFCWVFLPSLTVSLKNVSCQLWILPFSPTCCWECMYIYIYTQCIWRYIHRMTYKLAENHVMYNIYIGLYVTHIYIYCFTKKKKHVVRHHPCVKLPLFPGMQSHSVCSGVPGPQVIWADPNLHTQGKPECTKQLWREVPSESHQMKGNYLKKTWDLIINIIWILRKEILALHCWIITNYLCIPMDCQISLFISFHKPYWCHDASTIT